MVVQGHDQSASVGDIDGEIITNVVGKPKIVFSKTQGLIGISEGIVGFNFKWPLEEYWISIC